MQSGSLRSPACIQVLHFYLFITLLTFLHHSTASYFFELLVLGCSQVCFAHLPASKYYILFFFITLVLWCSQVRFTHLSAPKYCILLFKFSILSIVSAETYVARRPSVRPALICISFSRIFLKCDFWAPGLKELRSLYASGCDSSISPCQDCGKIL